MKSVWHWLWLAAHLLSFAVFSYAAFSRNFGNLAYGGDGGQEVVAVMHQWAWAPAALGFYSDPFQGMGDVWFNMNTKLIPGYLLPMLFEHSEGAVDAHFIVSSYVVFAGEMFLSILVLARALGMNWIVSIVSAWALPLLTYPYFGISLLFPFMMLSPPLSTLVAESLMLIWAIDSLGRGEGSLWTRLRHNLVPSLAALILLTAIVASQPLRAILCVPAVGLISLGSIFGARGAERSLKVALLVGISIVFIASGVGLFLAGMFSFTVPTFMSNELENVFTQSTLISIWYGEGGVGPMGPKLFAAGLIGMVVAAAFGGRRLRWYAASALTLVGLIFGLGYAALEWKFWRGPGPIYFEFLIWPLYVVFAIWSAGFVAARLVYLLSRSSRRVGAFARSPSVLVLTKLFFLIAIPGSAFAHAQSVSYLPNRMFSFPPTKPPVIATLQERIGLVPGSVFRGRVATMEQITKPNAIGWMDIVNQDWPRYAATGNDFAWLGLWYYDIPTLFEYGASMSPAYFRGITRLLARSDDKQNRNVVVLRRPDAHALGILGVRFIISDTELSEPFELVMTEHTHASESLFLYEVPDVNLGTATPTDARIATGFDAAVTQLMDPSFDAKRSVIVFDPAIADEHLVPANRAELRMIPGGLSVHAESAGTSMLVLPFEFSRCRQIRASGDDAKSPRLLRVNALETGVLFHGRLSAEIEYFTGPFWNSTCRLRDTQDFHNLFTQAARN